MKTNYLLIDFENVQPRSLSLLNGHPFRIYVFLGEHQNRIPVEMATVLQSFGQDAHYVQIKGTGRNALDFHIAYMLGTLAHTDPDAAFYVISRDSGFDPLIRFLKAKGFSVRRDKDICEIPLLKPAEYNSPEVKIHRLVEHLQQNAGNKPAKVTTLRNAIVAMGLSDPWDEELDQLVELLQKHRHITIEGQRIRYHLPKNNTK